MWFIEQRAWSKHSFVGGFPPFNPVHNRLLLLWPNPFVYFISQGDSSIQYLEVSDTATSFVTSGNWDKYLN